jgi:hypothetical protein
MYWEWSYHIPMLSTRVSKEKGSWNVRNGDRRVGREARRQIACERWRCCIPCGFGDTRRSCGIARTSTRFQARARPVCALTLVGGEIGGTPEIDVTQRHLLAWRAVGAEDLKGGALNAIDDLAIPVLIGDA